MRSSIIGKNVKCFMLKENYFYKERSLDCACSTLNSIGRLILFFSDFGFYNIGLQL